MFNMKQFCLCDLLMHFHKSSLEAKRKKRKKKLTYFIFS